MEKSFDFLLSNITVTVGIKQTQAKLQKNIFDKKWINMHYMTLCKYTDNIQLFTLDDINANFIDLAIDWFLKHVITDIK